ncbi:MAG: thioredoxin domain-containing protein [Spirochaetes bacterium]|nr:thioredoxin domain-containing protein [Spirochaetota bacterium]
MRKIYILLPVLSLSGMIISGLLVIDHYLPWVSSSILKCGPGASPCSELSSLSYSEIFGIPVASLGFFFYIWIFFSTMLFWESGKGFREVFAYVLLPVAAAGVISDFYFAGLLIYLGIFCKYCVMTYVINIIIFAVSVSWYLGSRKVSGTWLSRFRQFMNDAEKNGFLKFSSGAFLFFTTMLFLFVITFSLYLKEASSFEFSGDQSEQERMDGFFNDYISKKPEKISFPGSDYTSGNPQNKLEIIVVTDPFCSACSSFHHSSAPVLEKFKNDIYVKYFFYPLDSKCNSDVKNTVYKNTCEAVRTIAVFSGLAGFGPVYEAFYSNINDMENAFKRDEIDYHYIWEVSGLKDKVSFEQFSSGIKNFDDMKLKKLIQASIDNGVEATPTLFINGRRLEGTPPPELFERIIKYELSLIK